MPVYAYQAKVIEEGCDHCRDGFETVQSMKDDSLTHCPKCGIEIIRLIFRPSIATPHTPAELKNLGFTKLVKRDEGVYENLTKTGNEARYMERGKADTMPDIASKISD